MVARRPLSADSGRLLSRRHGPADSLAAPVCACEARRGRRVGVGSRGGALVNAILRALKATYNFFAGDEILLVATAVAFVLGLLLVHSLAAPNPLVAVVFVGCIVGGLALTLVRELRGRVRQR